MGVAAEEVYGGDRRERRREAFLALNFGTLSSCAFLDAGVRKARGVFEGRACRVLIIPTFSFLFACFFLWIPMSVGMGLVFDASLFFSY